MYVVDIHAIEVLSHVFAEVERTALAHCGAVEGLYLVGQFAFFDANARQWGGVDDFHLIEAVHFIVCVLSMALKGQGAAKNRQQKGGFQRFMG